ncbi:MAG: glycosyltransferase [Pseudomonadota bacterium]
MNQNSFIKSEVWFLIGALHGGGAEKQCFLQAKSLAEKGICTTIFLLSPPKKLNSIHEKLKIITLCDLSKGNKALKVFKILKSIFSIRKKLAKKSSNVIFYAWLEIPHFISFCSTVFSKAKLVWAIRNSNSGAHRQYWKMNLAVNINAFFSRYVDLFIANSHCGMEFYKKRKRYNIKLGKVLNNTIDFLTYTSIDSNQKKTLLQKHKLAEEYFIIVTVSRITPIKNIEMMINAIFYISQLKQKKIKWLHAGLGEKHYVSALKAMIDNYKLNEYIEFIGETDEVNEYMQLSDLFILSSLSEGSSNSLLEAIACKTLCISTNVGDSSRFLDSQTILSSMSSEDLAKKISWALSLPENEREFLIAKAYERVYALCNSKKNITQLIGFFSELSS